MSGRSAGAGRRREKRGIVAAIVALAGRVALGAAGVGLAGCVQTSRVDEAVTPAKLATAKKGVALIRIGTSSPECINVAALLGVKAGTGYEGRARIQVANVRSITQSRVAEVELDPGEYHLIGYSCTKEKGPIVVTDKAGGGLYGTSFAHFTIAAGEVVNAGYFHFGASHEGRSLFGRSIRADIKITEWPLDELDLFQKQRPTLYAQMKTRLMVMSDGPPSADELARTCQRWQALKGEGKAQDVPPECGGRAPERKTVR